MLSELETLLVIDCAMRILEKTGAVRSFFAPELKNSFFRKVIQCERLVNLSAQLISSDIYVHQTKLNTKHALESDWWEWHQDFTYRHIENGMPEPHVLTAMVFLNDTNEFNGPLLLIPGSHKEGIQIGEKNAMLSPETPGDRWYREYPKSTSYRTALTPDLKYTLKKKLFCTGQKEKECIQLQEERDRFCFFMEIYFTGLM
jgi:ectoine hydroxylase